MKKNESEKVDTKNFSPVRLAGRVIVFCCFLFMLAGIVKFGMKNILIDKGHTDSEFARKMIAFIYRDNPGAELEREKTVSIDWEKRYPFADEEDTYKGKTEKKQVKKSSGFISAKINNLEDKVSSIEKKISYYFEKGLLGKKILLETGAILEHILQWDIPEQVKNSPHIFWKGKTGHISQCKPRVDVTEISESLIRFAKWVQEQGIPFVYVQYPAKMSGIKAERIPKGYYSYTDENADRILEKLDESNIPCLDIREDMMPQDADHMFELFFRTDHHWLPQTGVKAAGLLAEYLKQKGMDIDTELFDPEKYAVKNYEGIFLGSYGRYVTAGLIDPDDFPVVTPDFETHFKIRIPSINMEKEGTFDETLLNMNMLYMQPSYELSQYDMYCWGDHPQLEIENKRTQNRNRILVLKESYGNVVIPYLALAVGEISLLDLRYFTGSVRTYIEEYNPDYVVVAYNPGMAAETAEDTSHTSPWDFR